MINSHIKAVYDELKATTKKKLVCLSTTANINNPEFYVGAMRETDTSLTANFIFRSLGNLEALIGYFDGWVDLFLVDCEIKNEVINLESEVFRLVKKSPLQVYKPNDITVNALDTWLSLLVPIMHNKQVAIIGIGNIGFKMAIRMAERGASVLLWDRDAMRTQQLADAVAHVIRGSGSIKFSGDLRNICQDTDVILGCTSGVAVIGGAEIESLPEGAIIIDVGNGTILPEGIERGHRRGLALYCLSPTAGFAGYLSTLENAKQQISKMARKVINQNLTIISPGVIGKFGDVIVDDVYNPARVIGVCDGKGDILSPDLAYEYKERFYAQ